MSAEKLLEITDSNYEAEAESDLPILLDFTGSWCPPCHAIEPHLKAIAEEYADRVRVARVDADTNPGMTDRFCVRSLPTLIMIRQREVVGQIVGAVPRARIRELVDAALQ